ncbi:MAG: TAXI family TRAP transporter solute-binding subunit [Amaricoccus sp.]|uniref:TAXI family TRAP transporter solute-binding subunit n=1 Tax=Amaricoccus sp. TaxID=1872485 RepID=UPI0039E410C5
MAAWQVAFRALAFAATLASATPGHAAGAAAEATAEQATAPEALAPAGSGAPDDGAADDGVVVPAVLARMGTGSIAGVYFPVGVALCRLANQHRAETGLRCAATQTAGSVANVAGLADGSLSFAIVQSDALAQAVAGSGAFAAAGPDTGLRAVMGLYPEALTLVARADAGVARVEDLAGKRVALGAEGSGTRSLADALMGALGWTAASFGATPDIAPERLGQALCDKQIDAFFVAIGHPARVVQEATTSCDARLVPVEGAAVDAMVKREPIYVAATIPGGLYRGTAGPVDTFGVSATLVTTASVPDATVAVLVRSVVDDLDMLRGLEPVLAGLDRREMLAAAAVAPLHPTAAAIYHERRWR